MSVEIDRQLLPGRAPGRRPRLRLLTAVVVVLTALPAALLSATGSAAAGSASPVTSTLLRPPVGPAALGPHVLVFTPTMPVAQIQAAVDAVAAQQLPAQFGDGRYALLFEPGTYGTAEQPLNFQVGYYTEVAGLGRSPRDVTIHGSIDVYNQCTPTAPGAPTDCTALNNFWRSMSNLTIELAGKSGCQASAEFWAVSQAAPLRRVQVTGGNVSLQDYCSAGPQYASGGFIADSAFSGGTVINGSQQQFYTRNTDLDGWTNGVWNQVFSGDRGAPAQGFPKPPYTTLATTPASKEKPFLYVDGSGQWQVLVPDAATASSGTSWQSAPTPGRSIPLSDFYIAHPSDSPLQLQLAALLGKNLLFTPGVYDIDRTLFVWRPGTVVLGLGFATLTAQRGAVVMQTADVGGIDIAGLTFDAGSVNSPVLLRLGFEHPRGWGLWGRGRAEAATALQDVFFRIGGPHVGKATVSVQVNTDGAILDDLWVWRADHGDGVGWTVNTADTGVAVHGDDVTATGLFVEHFQKDEVVWDGERGRTVFFQNEMPYDAPNQAAWSRRGVPGHPAYRVPASVRTHEAWGLGSYIFTNVDPTLHSANGFEVPVTRGVRMHDLSTVSLNKAGTIDHVINGVGAAVTPDVQGPSTVVDYPTG